jgi:hypothetical protein
LHSSDDSHGGSAQHFGTLTDAGTAARLNVTTMLLQWILACALGVIVLLVLGGISVFAISGLIPIGE